MKKIAIVLITTMWFSAPAFDINGNYQVFGIGVHKCSKVSKKRKSDVYNLVYKAWIAGYLTSFNKHELIGKQFTDLTSTKRIYQLVYKICENNPSFELNIAVFKASKMLHEKSYE